MSPRVRFALLVFLGFSFAVPVLAQAPACTCSSKPNASQTKNPPNPPPAQTPNRSSPPSKDQKPPDTPPQSGAGQNPHADRKGPPARTPSTEINVNVALGTASPDGQKSGHTHEEPSGKCAAALTEAEDAEKVWDLDFAYAKYAEAIEFCKGADQTHAIDRHNQLAHVKGTWWYAVGKSFPPLLWPFLHPWACIAAIVVLIIILSPRILPRGGFLYWLRWGMQSLFMPKFLGQATIITPNDLGKEPQVALFATALQYNARLARQLISGDREHLQVRSTTLLSVPSGLAASTFKDIPEIRGVNLGGIVQFLLNLGRYFGWRVETHLAFFPAPKSTAGGAPQSARMLAVATLRWAWFADSPIRVVCNVKDAQDVDDLAFAVAARVLGRYFVSGNSR